MLLLSVSHIPIDVFQSINRWNIKKLLFFLLFLQDCGLERIPYWLVNIIACFFISNIHSDGKKGLLEQHV